MNWDTEEMLDWLINSEPAYLACLEYVREYPDHFEATNAIAEYGKGMIEAIPELDVEYGLIDWDAITDHFLEEED